jgi:hypothetical protein
VFVGTSSHQPMRTFAAAVASPVRGAAGLSASIPSIPIHRGSLRLQGPSSRISCLAQCHLLREETEDRGLRVPPHLSLRRLRQTRPRRSRGVMKSIIPISIGRHPDATVDTVLVAARQMIALVLRVIRPASRPHRRERGTRCQELSMVLAQTSLARRKRWIAAVRRRRQRVREVPSRRKTFGCFLQRRAMMTWSRHSRRH